MYSSETTFGKRETGSDSAETWDVKSYKWHNKEYTNLQKEEQLKSENIVISWTLTSEYITSI